MAEERVQRRLAAILAADVVGYGRMMRETPVTLAANCTVPLQPRPGRRRDRAIETMEEEL